jgi:hypothetical protein
MQFAWGMLALPVLVSAACAARPSQSEASALAPAPGPSAEQAATARVAFSSDELAYEWTRFEMAPERVGLTGSGVDLVAARSPGKGTVIAALLVTDHVAVVPGVRDENRAGYLDSLKRSLQQKAEASSLSVEVSEKDRFYDFDGWRVTGTSRRQPGRFSIRSFGSGRREFLLWCEFVDPRALPKCAEAFAGLVVKEQPAEYAGATELRTGFVLDDPEVPVRYTPPGKGWSGRGPRLGGMGSQKVWTWVHPDLPQVEVGVVPLSASDAELDTEALAARMARNFQSNGTKVTKSSAMLDGKKAVRLKLDAGRLPIQDLIVISHDGHLCSLLITPRQRRDERFIAEALKGFRLR